MISGGGVGGTQNNRVVGNLIGLAADGSTVLANYGDGLQISGLASHTTIGGGSDSHRNVISGNTGRGISVAGGGIQTTIVGNYIGLDASGELATGNDGVGIRIANTQQVSIVGNVISNNSVGIVLSAAVNVTLSGNLIGTDKDGITDLGNRGIGIQIRNTSANIVVGGLSANDRNIVSGNQSTGIWVGQSANITVVGNYVGVDGTGNTALRNDNQGLYVFNSSSVVIGSANSGGGNVIGANLSQGIAISGSNNAIIQGNLIGVGVDQSTLLGNSTGIVLSNATSGTLIGGVGVATANVIANKLSMGVAVAATAGSGNTIRGNRMFNNNGRSIDIDSSGVTANDSGDGDGGANGRQNFPVINSAVTNGSDSLQILGSLNSRPSARYLVQVYANSGGSPTGHGEGERYIGEFDVLTDADGNVNFSGAIAGLVNSGETLSATATTYNQFNDPSSTSEFSQSIAVSAVASFAIEDVVVTAASGGLSFNATGNDAYLIADDGGAIFGGRTAFTIETEFTLGSNGEFEPLISYATAARSNEVVLYIEPADTIAVQIDSELVRTESLSNLRDGRAHSISVCWENSGATRIYVDGLLIHSASGLGVGTTITGGGQLIIGQEQDSFGGGFDVLQSLNGTLHRTRIFDHVRSDSQIQDGISKSLQHHTTGLVAQYNFADLTNTGVTTDSVAGNNLTVRHTSQTGFTAGTSELLVAELESVRDGDVVAPLLGYDVEREARIDTILSSDSTLRYSNQTNKFYRLVNSIEIWENAQSAAVASSLSGVSGELVTIDSAAENKLVQSFSVELGRDIWLGGSDKTEEGRWRWQTATGDRETFYRGERNGDRQIDRYSHFDPLEPNDFGGNEDYLLLRRGTGIRNDYGPANTAKAVFQYDADAVLDATNPLTYTLSSQTVAGAFAIDPSTGVVTVADRRKIDFDNLYEVIVAASDGNFSDQQTFRISITDLNEFAIAADGDSDPANNEVAENSAAGTTVGLTVFASDDDRTGNAISYSLRNDAGGRFTIDPATGVVLVNTGAKLDFELADSHRVDIRAVSSDGSFVDQSFVIRIGDTNETSFASDDAYVTNATETLSVGPSGVLANDSDTDGDVLSAILKTGPGNGVVNLLTNGAFAYTPAGGFFGIDSFEYWASDGTLPSNPATVTITVVAVQAVPGGGSGDGGSSGSGGGSSGSGSGSGGNNSGSGGSGGLGDGDVGGGSDNASAGVGGGGTSIDGTAGTDPNSFSNSIDGTAGNGNSAGVEIRDFERGDPSLDDDDFAPSGSDAVVVHSMSAIEIGANRMTSDERFSTVASRVQFGSTHCGIESATERELYRNDADPLRRIRTLNFIENVGWENVELIDAEVDDPFSVEYSTALSATTWGVATMTVVVGIVRAGMVVAALFGGRSKWNIVDPGGLLNASPRTAVRDQKIDRMMG